MIDDLLQNKPIIKGKDGEELVDLTKQNFSPTKSPLIIDYVFINKDMVGRPDVISVFGYGNDTRGGAILKQNNYSNPFAINEGDIFFLQDLGEFNKQIIDSGQETNIQNFRNQYIDPEKRTEKDAELNRFEKRDKTKKRRDGSSLPALPPNIANIGDTEFTVRGGKVIFGEDVTNNVEVCDKPISKAEFLNRLLKNRL